MTSKTLIPLAAFFLCALPSLAKPTASEQDQHKSGFKTRGVFGGPGTAVGQVEEDDRVKSPAFRFAPFDQVMEPWFGWKRSVNERIGLQLSGHYVSLYQGLDDSITSEKQAWSGFARANIKWVLVGRDTERDGALVVTVDHRHRFSNVAPSNLANQAGYLGQTGVLMSDAQLVLTNLNWQQDLNDGGAGIIVGRFDPTDYMNVLGYANPWTTFSNLAIILDASTAFADASLGIGAGSWIGQHWYAQASLNDANGTLTELNAFSDGPEFFVHSEVGWSPSRDERYLKNVHLTYWHVDEREQKGIDQADGFLLSANWTFDKRLMPFVRFGTSDGSAPIYNSSVTAGAIYKFVDHSDLMGLAVNWGDPAIEGLKEQITTEAFYRLQFAQNLAITPSLQLLADPALNEQQDLVWLIGLRLRFTF